MSFLRSTRYMYLRRRRSHRSPCEATHRGAYLPYPPAVSVASMRIRPSRDNLPDFPLASLRSRPLLRLKHNPTASTGLPQEAKRARLLIRSPYDHRLLEPSTTARLRSARTTVQTGNSRPQSRGEEIGRYRRSPVVRCASTTRSYEARVGLLKQEIDIVGREAEAIRVRARFFQHLLWVEPGYERCVAFHERCVKDGAPSRRDETLRAARGRVRRPDRVLNAFGMPDVSPKHIAVV